MNLKRLMVGYKISDSNNSLEAIRNTRFNKITEDMLKASGVYDLIMDYFPRAYICDLRGGGIAFNLTRYNNDWFFQKNQEFVDKMDNMLGDNWGIADVDGKFLMTFGIG